VIPYRDALQRIWVLDPVPAWAPTHNHLKKLIGSPKHHLVDPALAARLAGLDIDALLRGAGPKSAPEDGSFLGQLFESLATLNLRVFAQAQEARTFHMRTQQGLHEVDIIIERGDQRVVGVEVKLSESVIDEDVKHLAWLKEKLGDQMLDGIILTTGMTAYRRRDGFGVVPLALLGP
jgi:predicted AAA+ superfamily ATPase